MSAQLITTNGGELDIAPENGDSFTLAEAQGYVGGYVEAHTLPDGRLILINEDGISLQLPVNKVATVMAYNLHTGDGIRGDVVVCDQAQFN